MQQRRLLPFRGPVEVLIFQLDAHGSGEAGFLEDAEDLGPAGEAASGDGVAPDVLAESVGFGERVSLDSIVFSLSASA